MCTSKIVFCASSEASDADFSSMPALVEAGSADLESLEANPLIKRFEAKTKLYHERTPLLRSLPLPAVAIVGLLVLVNIAVWVAVGIVLVSRISHADHALGD